MTSTIDVRRVETPAPAGIPGPSAATAAFAATGRSEVEAYWDARAASFDLRDPTAIGRHPDVRLEWKAVLRDVLGDGPDAGRRTLRGAARAPA